MKLSCEWYVYKFIHSFFQSLVHSLTPVEFRRCARHWAFRRNNTHKHACVCRCWRACSGSHCSMSLSLRLQSNSKAATTALGASQEGHGVKFCGCFPYMSESYHTLSPLKKKPENEKHRPLFQPLFSTRGNMGCFMSRQCGEGLKTRGENSAFFPQLLLV